MSDLISRQDAIEAVRNELVCDGRHEAHDKTCRFIADVILSALPSAEAVDVNDVTIHYKPYPSADRPTGEWIDIDNYYRLATCSHCHKVTMFEKWGEYTKPYNFCPNCGAKMKGGNSE